MPQTPETPPPPRAWREISETQHIFVIGGGILAAEACALRGQWRAIDHLRQITRAPFSTLAEAKAEAERLVDSPDD